MRHRLFALAGCWLPVATLRCASSSTESALTGAPQPDAGSADAGAVGGSDGVVTGNAAPGVLQSLIGGGVAVMQNGKWATFWRSRSG
jgi:hypothetical protein